MVFLISALERYFSFIDQIEPTVLFYGLLLCTWILAMWEHYLSYRQYRNFKHRRTVPTELVDVMTDEQLEKSRLYAMEKIRFSQIHSIYDEVEGTVLLLIGVLPWLWSTSGSILSKFGYHNYDTVQSIVFVVIMMSYSTIAGIPWSYYYHFVLEEKHGFNKQTRSFFIKDTIKKMLVTLFLTIPIFSLLLKIIQIGGDYFFIYAWAFIASMSLGIAIIYPNYIAPLFDRYEPLREGELRTSIEQLANKIHFPLAKIFVVEGSARSAHSNAYFYGFFKTKRIVLYDTLIKGYNVHEDKDEKSNDDDSRLPEKKLDKGCESDEVLAVLCHEFGHWSLSHNIINLSISFINLFVIFIIFALLFKRVGLYDAFGFTQTQPIIIGLLIIFQYVLSPYSAVLSLCLTVLSRRFEFQADNFALKLAHGDPLSRALKKLEMDNMTYPYSDYLFAKYHYSHPTVLERLKALKPKKQD
ncbi:unnamed protein product [Adineta ricciae]|uniref:CAAX prenyl protease n=1 Tax=Adineta ricciae TaxID=249248 RepID=A0A813S755_ADIRI|nr:unnamed protein product [Adineta ricciae]CAF1656345.1 unnamed protein product [Adineta ricciae]